MKLVMLARNPSLYSHRRVVEVARARGHDIDVINTLRVHMNITSSKPTLWHGGRMLAHYDAVIPNASRQAPATRRPMRPTLQAPRR